jgi:hypothetical protein
MHHSAKASSTRALFKKAATLAVSHTFPAWIDATEFGVIHASAVPRIRDSLVLRLVAGRRQERGGSLIHAPGSP